MDGPALDPGLWPLRNAAPSAAASQAASWASVPTELDVHVDAAGVAHLGSSCTAAVPPVVPAAAPATPPLAGCDTCDVRASRGDNSAVVLATKAVHLVGRYAAPLRPTILEDLADLTGLERPRAQVRRATTAPAPARDAAFERAEALRSERIAAIRARCDAPAPGGVDQLTWELACRVVAGRPRVGGQPVAVGTSFLPADWVSPISNRPRKVVGRWWRRFLDGDSDAVIAELALDHIAGRRDQVPGVDHEAAVADLLERWRVATGLVLEGRTGQRLIWSSSPGEVDGGLRVLGASAGPGPAASLVRAPAVLADYLVACRATFAVALADPGVAAVADVAAVFHELVPDRRSPDLTAQAAHQAWQVACRVVGAAMPT